MAAPTTPVTWDAYVAADLATEARLELYDGAIYAMAGGTPAHAAIAGNIVAALHTALADRPCITMTSDVRVALQDDAACYPDATVVCGEAVFRDPHTLVNPTVVVEVLSPSTERWDRGGKLDRYRTLPSLRYVLLVAHDTWHVTLFARGEQGAWTWTTAGPGEHIFLMTLEVTLAVDAIYRGAERVGGPSRDRGPTSRRGVWGQRL